MRRLGFLKEAAKWNGTSLVWRRKPGWMARFGHTRVSHSRALRWWVHVALHRARPAFSASWLPWSHPPLLTLLVDDTIALILCDALVQADGGRAAHVATTGVLIRVVIAMPFQPAIRACRKVGKRRVYLEAWTDRGHGSDVRRSRRSPVSMTSWLHYVGVT